MSAITFNSLHAKEKKEKPVPRTIRICLAVPEASDDNYAEFNYKEELQATKKKRKEKSNGENVKAGNNNPGLDPFDENDDDVKRIAMQFEAKYGGAVPNKKKKRGKKDDYADIGMGYDESDSFIDNTDGYDEMVPPNVTTLHGGFYINCGALEFKTDDEGTSEESSSESEDELPEKSTKRKRILETSDESDGEKKTEKTNTDEKKQKLDSNGVSKPAKKVRPLTPDRERDKPKKIRTPNIKELLREKKIEMDMTLTDLSVIEEDNEVNTSSILSTTAIEVTTSKEKSSSAKVDNITSAIESVIKAQVVPEVQEGSDSDSRDCPNGTEVVKLPENLPPDIVELINKIKEAASTSTEGKVKFFAGPVSQTLLLLERKCKCLGRNSKVKVYEHLAPFVRCRKETLMKRAKNLVLEDDQKKLKNHILRFKATVNKLMPSLIQNYESELAIATARRVSLGEQNDEAKAIKIPKRRFQWSAEAQNQFKEIILLKRKCALAEGKTKEALEGFMIAFLKNEIIPIWPEGWITVASLQRQCNVVFEIKKNQQKPFENPENNTKKSETTLNLPKSLSSNPSLSITPVKNGVLENAKQDLEKSVKPVNLDIDLDLTITPTRIPVIDLDSEQQVDSKSETVIIADKLAELEKKRPVLNIIPLSKMKEEAANNVVDLSLDDTVKIPTTPQKRHSYSDDYTKIINASAASDRSKKSSSDTSRNSTQVYNDFVNNFSMASSSPMPPPRSVSNPMYSAPGVTTSDRADFNMHRMSPYSVMPTIPKGSDDIQKVMDDLKALQKLSSPNKNDAAMGSPVSVIAYNKSSPPFVPPISHSMPSPASFANPTYGAGFQEAFQRQFEINFLKNSAAAAAATSTAKYSSPESYGHPSTTSYTTDKYYQPANNNYPASLPGSHRVPPTQTGTYSNIFDDMLTNVFTEYGYPRPANQKPKAPHK